MSLRDIGLALIVVVVWGLNFIAIKWAVADLPPLFVTALRYVGAALPAVFFVRRPRVALPLIIGYGLAIGVAQFGLLFTAISWGMPAGLASLVLQVQAFFTIALALVLLGERLAGMQYAGALIAIAGVAAIAVERAQGLAGALLPLMMTVLAGFFWGVSNIIVKKAKPTDMLSFVVWTSLVPPLPLFALSVLLEGRDAFIGFAEMITWRSALSLAFIAYLATIFGFAIWSMLLNRYKAGVVAPFSLLVPVVGMSASYLLLAERITLVEAAGAGLIMAGLTLAVMAPRIFGVRSI